MVTSNSAGSDGNETGPAQNKNLEQFFFWRISIIKLLRPFSLTLRIFCWNSPFFHHVKDTRIMKKLPLFLRIFERGCVHIYLPSGSSKMTYIAFFSIQVSIIQRIGSLSPNFNLGNTLLGEERWRKAVASYLNLGRSEIAIDGKRSRLENLIAFQPVSF